jgi:hypothetical protein
MLEDRTVPSVVFPANNGFERPNLLSNGSGNFHYPLGGGAVTLADQGGAGWVFSGLTGVADNGSDPFGNSFNVVNATNSNQDGTTSNFGQAALIQNVSTITSFGPSVISQAMTFAQAGNVSVTFSLEMRDGPGRGNNPIDVKFDDLDLGTYLAQSSTSFNTVTTPSVFLTAGSHTLSFTGTNTQGADNTQFIDNVQVNVPDPTPPTPGIGQLTYPQFKTLTPDQIPQLTAAQIASIPDNYWFVTIPAEDRAALTATQVQALNTAVIDPGFLTPTQRGELTTAQVQQLPFWGFQYLPAALVPQLTPQQIASIPDNYWFATMSNDERAALTAGQVQALNIPAVNIGYLTPVEVRELTAAQVGLVPFWQFQYLDPSQIPALSTAQIASITDSYWLATLSGAARAALTSAQVQTLDTAAINIGYLTATQRLQLTTGQIQQLAFWQLQYLDASQVAALTLGQMAAIPDGYWFSTLSAAARAALSPAQLAALTFLH